MADVFHVVKSKDDTLATIARQHNTTVEKLLQLNRGLSKDSPLKIGDRIKFDWIRYRLSRPKVLAVATHVFTPSTPFPDVHYLPGVSPPKYGPDITFGTNRPAPGRRDVGKTPAELKPKMEKLLKVVAHNEKTGMTRRLFDEFLKKQNAVKFFEDENLNQTAAKHENIIDFADLAMMTPDSIHKPNGKVRIHQALKNSGWDIDRVAMLTDLGVPAFNKGRKELQTGDFGNGLGVMVNSIQYAYAVATAYDYDEEKRRYTIELNFIIYDVFGLDDEDVEEYGAFSDNLISSGASIGVTAWWQLQHQHGFAPLVTRVVVPRRYEVTTQ